MAVSVSGAARAMAQDSFPISWNRLDPMELWQEGASPEGQNGVSGEWTRESIGELESRETRNPFDEPIETDRHDFTQSPKVVGRGVRQLEYGVTYSTRSEGTKRETTYATPELLFRYGLNERAEFRTKFNYGWKFDNEAEDFEGGEDLIFGIKYQLTEQRELTPDSAVELRLTAPTGADDLTTGRWEPGVDYIYGWKIGDNVSFTGSTGGNANALGDISFITIDTDPQDHYIAWTQSFALGAKLTEKSTGYFEWFGIFTHGRDDDDSLSFLNFGVDYLISNNLVADFRIGWGLTEASDDLFAGVGGAFRF
jgi:hypothetical protein